MAPKSTPQIIEPNWNLAQCRQGTLSSDVWFSDDTEQLAVSICFNCKIRSECLQYALTKPENFGVWGGMTEKQRKVVRWTKSRVRCPGCGGVQVDDTQNRIETCLGCGLSWKI